MNQRLRRQKERRERQDKPGDVSLLAERLGFVFIHIPKTGGTSIKQALGPLSPFGHKTAMLLQSSIEKSVWDSAFKFCIVRNPWDRMVSWFEFGRLNMRDRKNNYYKSFDAWVLDGMPHGWGTEWKLPEQENDPLNQLNFFMLYRQKSLVNFMGRYEHLEEDFEYIREHVGRHVSLPHINKSTSRKGRNYRDYYTAETQQIVANRFAEEIKYLGYQF
jgi:hypothetical protein